MTGQKERSSGRNLRSRWTFLLLVIGSFLLWIVKDLGTSLSRGGQFTALPLTDQGRAPSVLAGTTDCGNHTTQSGILRPRNPQSEPKWPWKEEFSTRHPTAAHGCSDSLRLTASRSDWLKGLFLPDITLFLERGHFNDRKWELLQNFVPPFGWMGLNYTVVKDVMSQLPGRTDAQIYNRAPLPGCVRCAVVGNGGILKDSKMGTDIDSHDYIFRGNGAVIRGFEEDVGSRTSFYGFTETSLRDCLAKLRSYGFTGVPADQDTRYLHLPEAATDYNWLKGLLLHKEGINSGVSAADRRQTEEIFHDKMEKLFVLHPDFLRYIKCRFLKSKTLKGPRWYMYRPSVGAVLLMTALHLCDKVDAYGFMTENYQHFSGYYYDRVRKPLRFSENHDFFLERDLWSRMDYAGVIRLYHRT